MSEHEFEEEEFEGAVDRGTLVRTAKLSLNHWPLLLLFVGSTIAVAFIENYQTFLSKRIIDEGIVPKDTEALISIAWQYFGVTVLLAIFVGGFILSAATISHWTQYDLRKAMFEKLQGLSFTYYDRTPLGWLMSRMTSDVNRVGELVSWGFLDITWGVFGIASALGFMFYINWQLALIVLALIPVLIVVAIQFQKLIIGEYRVVRRTNSKITGSYSESINGVRVVKSLRREEKNLEEFQDLTNEMFRAGFRAAWLSALFLPAVQMLTALGVAAVIWYGGFQYTQGWITIGTIQAFVSYITFMLWPVQEMARVFASMQQAIASAERIFSLIDEEADIVDRPGAEKVPNIRGVIEFDHVDFRYEADKPVLQDFSLMVKPGETIALVGPTGAGKSTVVNLLCRFYEPVDGQIRINGKDYLDLTLDSIHSRIGMVLQTPHLFSGTVMENIRYGRLDASDEEVVSAARMAGAHDFITLLDEGYTTEVGEGGVLLSVGQKQLLSLGRAILAQPDIFIMDEATSSVDTLTEALIQKAMDHVMEGRTSFVIAHRLSTIKRADRIIVLKDGRIDEIGSHAELIRQKGHYYNLYTKQFAKERGASVPDLLA
ncbi:MAG: ABC transporter ATP-binding protein [Anaerolineae bacterium]